MSVRKQLLLSALLLPSDAIHLIKEFAWIDVKILAKKRKSHLLAGIKSSEYTHAKYYSLHPKYHVFWIEGERNQFQSCFCNCGQYVASRSIIILKCKCTCNFV